MAVVKNRAISCAYCTWCMKKKIAERMLTNVRNSIKTKNDNVFMTNFNAVKRG